MPTSVGNGRTIARLDLAYPERRLAIEIDGFAYHSGRIAWQRDLARQNRLMRRGWRLLRFTHEDIEHRTSATVELIRSEYFQSSAGVPNRRW